MAGCLVFLGFSSGAMPGLGLKEEQKYVNGLITKIVFL